MSSLNIEANKPSKNGVFSHKHRMTITVFVIRLNGPILTLLPARPFGLRLLEQADAVLDLAVLER
jgi:hypothetical protein